MFYEELLAICCSHMEDIRVCIEAMLSEHKQRIGSDEPYIVEDKKSFISFMEGNGSSTETVEQLNRRFTSLDNKLTEIEEKFYKTLNSESANKLSRESEDDNIPKAARDNIERAVQHNLNLLRQRQAEYSRTLSEAKIVQEKLANLKVNVDIDHVEEL